MVQLPVTELARRMCVNTHRADLRPQPQNMPCSEHRRFAQLYYGLIDPAYGTLLATIVLAAAEEKERDAGV